MKFSVFRLLILFLPLSRETFVLCFSNSFQFLRLTKKTLSVKKFNENFLNFFSTNEANVDLADATKSCFDGVQRLYGEQGYQYLRRSHVCIVGVGGVGSWAAEALARTGIGQITLIDLDDVCTSNINRQLVALLSTVGKQKIDVLKERILDINPHCTVNLVHDFLSKDNAKSLLCQERKTQEAPCYDGRFDCVLDCIDGQLDKCHLIDICARAAMPVVCVGAAGGKNDPTKIQVADITRVQYDNLLAKVRKGLRMYHNFPKGSHKKIKKRDEWGLPCVYSTETVSLLEPENERLGFRKCDSNFGTATFVTGTFGFIAAALVCRVIAEQDQSLKWSQSISHFFAQQDLETTQKAN